MLDTLLPASVSMNMQADALQVAVRLQRGPFVLDADLTCADAMSGGAIIALFGRSGSGKTTLVNAIAGLQLPEQGRIVIKGQVLLDTANNICMPVEQRRIGYVFQEPRLFPHLNVRRNLLYGLQRTAVTERYIEFATVVELLGLSALLSRQPQQLSGGERHRVALGRALLAQPQLLLLDEPWAAFDLARREEVWSYLLQLRSALALPMVLVTHQFDEVLRLATHVVVLDQGKTIAQGAVTDTALQPVLRQIVGTDAVGAVIEGVVHKQDVHSQYAQLPIGHNVLQLQTNVAVGTRVRVQLLARDLIVATRQPEALSVRNILAGTVHSVVAENAHNDLVHVDIGGVIIFARVTHVATMELALRPGLPVWVLLKTVSMHVYSCVSNE